MPSSSAPAQAPASPGGTPSHRWGAAVVVLSAAALALVNSTIANVAVPSIQRDLDLSSAGVAWTLAGWALTYALALIPAGQLGDRYGHRRFLLLGLGLFALASLAAVFVQDEAQLVVVRLVQGAAGGLFYPAIAATLSALFVGAERARVFGALGAVIGAGAAAGPLLGGFLLQALGDDAGWRAIFLLNVVLSLAILVAGWILLPPLRFGRDRGGFDTVGFVFVGAGLTAALVPLILGQNLGWPIWGWALLGAGLAVLVLFVVWERHRERAGRSAVVPPSLFRDRDFALSVALSLVQFAGFISIFYVLALLWQTGLQRAPLEMGFLTLPEAVGTIIGSVLVARLTALLGSRGAITLGMLGLTLGIGASAAILFLVPAESLTIFLLLGPLLVTGVGGGIGISATLHRALSSVARERSGIASGVVATVQRSGNALGLAAVGGVFFAVLAAGAATGDGYAHAAAIALVVCAATVAIGVVLALLLRRDRPGAEH